MNPIFTKVTILITIFFMGFIQSGKTQDEEDGFYQKYLQDKFYTGGGLGLSFNGATVINISPILGYKVIEKLRSGVGINYLYVGFRGQSSTAYGYNFFSNYSVIPELYIASEYQMMNIAVASGRGWVDAFLIGGGYRQNMGNTFLNFEILYDVLNGPNSIVQNPVVRGGVGVGL